MKIFILKYFDSFSHYEYEEVLEYFSRIPSPEQIQTVINEKPHLSRYVNCKELFERQFYNIDQNGDCKYVLLEVEVKYGQG